MLLHLQAGILGKAVGSAIAPPYLLCRSCAPFWASLLGLLAKFQKVRFAILVISIDYHGKCSYGDD